MSKSNKELVDLIIRVEDDLLRNEPSLLDILPTIRSYFHFNNRTSPPRTNTPQAKKSFFKRLSSFVNVMSSMFSVLYVFVVVRFRPIEYLLVAPALHRNVPTEKGFLSKHLDSLKHFFRKHRCFVLEYGEPGLGKSGYPNLTPAIQWLNQPSLRSRETDSQASSIARRVVDSIRKIDPEFPVDRERLERTLQAQLFAMSFYNRLFQKVKCQQCVFVVFYAYECLAMISALNRNGYDTADYQHGIQNDYHPVYTHWEAMPSKPASIPKRFLVWDEVAFARIEKWGSAFGLQINQTGNLWIEQNARSISQNIKKEANASQGNRSILVALQAWPDHFNENILAVVGVNPEITWYFRVHPFLKVPAEDKAALESRYPNIVFETVKSRKVDEAIMATQLCITGASTVGIEALHYGKPCIFTHKNALDGLHAYIDDRRCFYAEDAESIASIVKGLMQGNSAVEATR